MQQLNTTVQTLQTAANFIGSLHACHHTIGGPQTFLRRGQRLLRLCATVNKVFLHHAAQRILAMTQGACSVAQYAVEFRTLAVLSSWGDLPSMADCETLCKMSW